MTARPDSSDGGVDGHAVEVPCNAIGLARPFRHGRRPSPFDDLSSPPLRPLHRGRWLEEGGLCIAPPLPSKTCPALGVHIDATAQSAVPFRHAPFRNARRRWRVNVRDTVWCPYTLGYAFRDGRKEKSRCHAISLVVRVVLRAFRPVLLRMGARLWTGGRTFQGR